MTGKAKNTQRHLVGALAFCQALLFAWPAVATAEEMQETSRGYEEAKASAVPLNGSKPFDALAVRPTTFLTSVFSSAAFVISLPFTALDPAIGAGKAKETLVDYPFNDTFKRPLGDLDAMGNPAGDPYPR
jgi:hypothetical protein